MVTSRLLACVASLLLLTLSALDGQERFRTATRLVEVPVVVTDRAGKHVEGLTRDDFAITEDGIPQTISIFEVTDTRAARTAAPPASRRLAAAEQIFTNAVPNAFGSIAVIVLDRQNAAFDSQWFARKHIDAYVSRMRTGDRVALYVLDGGIRVLHDFSCDAASIRRALDVYQARVTGDYDASNEPPAELPPGDTLPVWIVDPSTAVSDFFMKQRWRNTFHALQVLAGHLSGVAGRKTVVWVSEVFPIPTGLDRQEFLEEMRKTTRAMNDAQASLYPVDARGLVGAISYFRGKPRFTTLGNVRGNIETMEIVADDTGGRAFANSNALDVSIGRALDDSRLTYLLGYYPTDARSDGRFRTIGVTVRRKGLQARYRRGYVAASPAPDVKGRDAALRDALETPLAATQVGLSAVIEYDKSAAAVRIRLRIDPATLALEHAEGRLGGDVDVLVAEVSRTARGIVVATERLEVSIPDSDRAAVFRDGIPVMMTVDVTRYLHELRIVARDVTSGRVGSLVIRAQQL
jgi:VWFA-related protein